MSNKKVLQILDSIGKGECDVYWKDNKVTAIASNLAGKVKIKMAKSKKFFEVDIDEIEMP